MQRQAGWKVVSRGEQMRNTQDINLEDVRI